jgi:hypothetical protein
MDYTAAKLQCCRLSLTHFPALYHHTVTTNRSREHESFSGLQQSSQYDVPQTLRTTPPFGLTHTHTQNHWYKVAPTAHTRAPPRRALNDLHDAVPPTRSASRETRDCREASLPPSFRKALVDASDLVGRHFAGQVCWSLCQFGKSGRSGLKRSRRGFYMSNLMQEPV